MLSITFSFKVDILEFSVKLLDRRISIFILLLDTWNHGFFLEHKKPRQGLVIFVSVQRLQK